MEDEDFLAIIALLEDELRAAGAAEVADERHYVSDVPDGGRPRLLEPRKRLIEMLRAFDRHLATEDPATYRSALARIAEATRGEGPAAAEIELTADDRDRERVPLDDRPELDAIREELAALIAALLEGGGGATPLGEAR